MRRIRKDRDRRLFLKGRLFFRNRRLSLFLIAGVFVSGAALAQQGPVTVRVGAIGEAFGKPVSAEEFNYHYKTASIFTRTGKEDRSEDETVQEAWENLIYIYEAKELGITISPEELRSELERLMSEKDMVYGTEAYYTWIKNQLNEEPGVFERRIHDLLVINRFMKVKTDPDVTVTEEEMKQKFLNQYNSFESEYIRFEDRDEAEEFLKKVKENAALWKDTYDKKKEEGQKGAAWINIMSLEALIDLWKIPKDDAYDILSRKEGDFIVAEFFYGIGVFRLLRSKHADMEKYTEKKQENYRNTITMVKKRKIVRDYFEDLIRRAGYKDYVADEKRRRKIEELKKESVLVLETNRGIIEVKLFPETAPKACENFIGLAKKGYYDSTIFHRVIKDFVIQGGDPTGTGTGGDSLWGEPFMDELKDEIVFDKPGLLAMANSGPNTNKSQFFITTNKAPNLNKKHTIFGEVVSGYDVVEKIESTPTDSNNRPEEEQKIIKAYIKTQKEAESNRGRGGN